jgi:hypothetical protein
VSGCAYCGGSGVPARPNARYCSDRCRRGAYNARHAPLCTVCGGATSDPRTTRHLGCTDWTPERALDALRDFAEEHGRVPTAGEFGVGPNRDERVAWIPAGETLRRLFGSRRAALIAAGLTPRHAGRYARNPRPGDRLLAG